MYKKIFLDKNALKELQGFPKTVEIKFEALLIILKELGKLEFPESKKIDKNLYEIRVKFKGEYRGFYAYYKKDYIIILHFFRKKTQKTPIKNIKTAKKRLKQYE